MKSIQDGINKDKERNSKFLNDISYKIEFTPEDIRQALNAVCFDPSPENIDAVRALSDQIYRQQWYYKNTGIN